MLLMLPLSVLYHARQLYTLEKQSPLLLTKELWSSKGESTSNYCIRILSHLCRKIYPSTLLVQPPLTPKPEPRAMTAHELVMFQNNPDISQFTRKEICRSAQHRQFPNVRSHQLQ